MTFRNHDIYYNAICFKCKKEKEKMNNDFLDKAVNAGGGYTINVERAKTHSQKMAERQRKESAALREIGELPAIVNIQRRQDCADNLILFLKTYFPAAFYREFSPNHVTAINKLQKAIAESGLFALAMPRGSGKSTICKRAILWALLYGYRHYVVIVADNITLAENILASVKSEIENNKLLAEDFPEVCFPVSKLENIVVRARSQTYKGKLTRIQWGTDKIVLPTIDGSFASEGVCNAFGILSGIRGLTYSNSKGEEIRPDFVLIDDPQNDESALSPEQIQKRIDVINGAILGLAGMDKGISGVCTCTVIAKGDVAERLLDNEISPEWEGSKFKLLDSMPENMELWKQFDELFKMGLRQNKKNLLATAFYSKNRAEMDKGAKASWEERYLPKQNQLSAIQYAMELYCRNKKTFFAEYQNEPLEDDLGGLEKLKVENIFAKINNRKRLEVPINCEKVIGFIDVQGGLLYYTICAFSFDFTCYVIDYGSYPKQPVSYYTLADATRRYTDLDETSGESFNVALTYALRALTDDICSRVYFREDGAEMTLDRCLIDSGWGKSALIIYQFIKESNHKSVLLASKGVGITADKKPYNEYKKGLGDVVGDFWIIPNVRKKRTAKIIEYDTNYVKTMVRSCILMKDGAAGGFSLFGEKSDIEEHRMFAEQLTAEYATPTMGRNRRVDVWKCQPNRDNHFFDCVIGCYVGASERGLKLENFGSMQLLDMPIPEKPKKREKKFVKIPDEFLVDDDL